MSSFNHRFAVSRVGTIAALGVTFIPGVALAHHDMDGATPATLFQGFMSGLVHPVIGLDHLAMVLLIGAYCGATRRSLAPAAAFAAAGLVGCLLHVARLDLPKAETSLAVSLVIAGLLALSVTRAPTLLASAVLGLMGLLHGYAYGESIVGAESTPLVAYLVGFTLVQLTIAIGAWAVTRGGAQEGARSRDVYIVRGLSIASALVGVAALI